MDQHFQANVFLLSCNILDRFLRQLGIKKSQFQVRNIIFFLEFRLCKLTLLFVSFLSYTLFQLVAAATVFIASKLVEPCPISGTDLIRYTDDTYQLTELLVSNRSRSRGRIKSRSQIRERGRIRSRRSFTLGHLALL